CGRSSVVTRWSPRVGPRPRGEAPDAVSAQHLLGARIDVGGGIEGAGVSDTGRVRRDNQDRWLAFPLADPGGCVLIVADGMGGEAEGGGGAPMGAGGGARVSRAP